MASRGSCRRFHEHCLGLFVNDILNGPRRPYPTELSIVAGKEGVPERILVAIWLIERNRRPRVICLVENAILRLNTVLFALLGIPILNLSVGPFQLKIDQAVKIARLRATVGGNRVKFISDDPSSKKSVIRFLQQLGRLDINATLAAQHILSLYREYCMSHGVPLEADYSRNSAFLRYLGRKYNDEALSGDHLGVIVYGRVLESVVRAL